MKPIKSLLVLLVLCAPALASAQGYYGGPPSGRIPGGFHNRAGRLAWGFGLELGGMHDSGGSITCDNCDVNPLALEVDAHLGGMVSPRLAVLFELQANAQTLHADAINGDSTLSQTAAMLALQFWLIPQLWIKGGIGLAHLSIDQDVFSNDVSNGVAILGAAGIELFSARNFAIDLEARIIEGSYNSLGDNIVSGTIGIGLDWY